VRRFLASERCHVHGPFFSSNPWRGLDIPHSQQNETDSVTGRVSYAPLELLLPVRTQACVARGARVGGSGQSSTLLCGLPWTATASSGCAITFCNQRDGAQHSHEIRSREQTSVVYPRNTIWQGNSTRTGSRCCYSKISSPLPPIQTATQMRKQAESIPVRCSTMG
jgi:hypothetical protein